MSQPLKHIGWILRIACLLAFVGAAWLTLPVGTPSTNLKTNFTTAVHNLAVDKVDLLFMIDNSASMGDKQALLAAAIPDMVTRLVTPNCVDATGAVVGTSDQTGQCTNGTAEFPPVHDMHIGIVSSSLGARGGNVCDPTATNMANPTLNAHQDDRGELIARGGSMEVNVPNAGSLNFLAWFPSVMANQGVASPPVPPETVAGAPGQMGTLIGDFASMIQGVNEHGCGYEAQNEAWYRFLVQPDPFQSLTVDSNNKAQLSGIDATILQQRAQFLRPDSLLAVIVVTDENEQVSNPNAVLQEAWLFDTYPFQGAPQTSGGPAGAPEGTAACGTLSNSPGPNPGPNDPNCTWCAYTSVTTAPNFAQQCPADLPNGTQGYLDPSDDGILLRFFDEKQRFGVVARYPVSRYVVGLTSPTVPSLDQETDSNGNYVGDQTQNENCVNPIFAQNLPTSPTADLCHLTPGPRTPDLVFYAAIAGVPHQLLQAAPGDPECPAGTDPADCPQKAQLADSDWTKIIGTDPVNYDFSGMDFHMLESDVSRAGSACPPGSNDDCDPVNGREWDTTKKDLEYACIFPLVDPQTGAPQPKDCTLPQFTGACDCATGAFDNGAPLCQKDANGNYTTTQVNGKAYPSAREMEIAHAMATQNGGVQGIVSSLCPIHPSQVGGATDPLYGYRPAVNAIVDRLKQALNVQCLPQQLAVDPTTGSVPCLILVTLPTQGGESACDSLPGLSQPTLDVLSQFQAVPHAAWLNGGGASHGLPDPSLFPTCVLDELTATTNGGTDFVDGSCAMSTHAGWCYVEGAAAGSCPQQILFTPGQPTHGASVSLQCIEQTNSAPDGG